MDVEMMRATTNGPVKFKPYRRRKKKHLSSSHFYFCSSIPWNCHPKRKKKNMIGRFLNIPISASLLCLPLCRPGLQGSMNCPYNLPLPRPRTCHLKKQKKKKKEKIIIEEIALFKLFRFEVAQMSLMILYIFVLIAIFIVGISMLSFDLDVWNRTFAGF